MTQHLIALLDIANRLHHARCDLSLTVPGAGAHDAAVLLDRARRLVCRAAVSLGKAQWQAEEEASACRLPCPDQLLCLGRDNQFATPSFAQERRADEAACEPSCVAERRRSDPVQSQRHTL